MFFLKIKNLRIFRIVGDRDLYDQVLSELHVITIYERENAKEATYLGNQTFIPDKGLMDIDEKAVHFIAEKLDVKPKLVISLLRSAEDQDEDGMYEWLENHGGELLWFNLQEDRDIAQENALDEYADALGVLVSQSVDVEAVSFNKSGIKFEKKTIPYHEAIGHYDEEEEWFLIYRT